jgi:hypothetical protein
VQPSPIHRIEDDATIAVHLGDHMTLEQTIKARQLARRRSLLVPWGAVLVALAFVVPRALAAGSADTTGVFRAVALVLTDLFRLGFFVGLAFLVVGKLRNRRWQREARVAARSVE